MVITNPFVILANNAMITGAGSGLGNVRAMNLSLNGVESQDLLALLPQEGTTPVPEPRRSCCLDRARRSQHEAPPQRRRRRIKATS